MKKIFLTMLIPLLAVSPICASSRDKNSKEKLAWAPGVASIIAVSVMIGIVANSSREDLNK